MKIFLSYASENQDLAEKIYMALLAGNHKVFFDKTKFKGGDNYHKKIYDQIQKSDFFIFLISRYSLQEGRYVQTELSYAKTKWPKPWKNVLPVKIEPLENDNIDSYLTSATIFEPKGNIPAEIFAETKKRGSFRNGIFTRVSFVLIIPVSIILYLFLFQKEPCVENIKYLNEIEQLLVQTKSAYQDLDQFRIKDSSTGNSNKRYDIYESFLISARQKIDTSIMSKQIKLLMENNQKIVDILANLQVTKSDDFKNTSDSFVNHAIRSLARYHSIYEVMNSGQQLKSSIAFPTTFPEAVKKEIEKCR